MNYPLHYWLIAFLSSKFPKDFERTATMSIKVCSWLLCTDSGWPRETLMKSGVVRRERILAYLYVAGCSRQFLQFTKLPEIFLAINFRMQWVVRRNVGCRRFSPASNIVTRLPTGWNWGHRTLEDSSWGYVISEVLVKVYHYSSEISCSYPKHLEILTGPETGKRISAAAIDFRMRGKINRKK